MDSPRPVHRLQPRRLRRARRRPRFAGLSFNRLVPNIMTMLGLCAGLTSVRYAIEAHFAAAAVAIVVAGCIDGVDGRLARMLKGTSRFGAEFDSLADFLGFGVAPAFLMYLWSLEAAGGIGFVPCLLFAVCMALRLARFNASLEQDVRGGYAYNFFTGVPAPAGAGLAMFPLFVGLEGNALDLPWLVRVAQYPLIDAVVLIGTAALLVSTLPVWSFKNFRVPRDYAQPLLLGVGLFAAVLVAEPWAALAAAGMIYAAMLPFSQRSYHRLRAEAEAEDEELN